MQQFTVIKPLSERTNQNPLCKEEIYTHIFETYYKRIYNYMYYRIACQTTAEDLTSQVFEKLLLNLSKYEEKKGSFEVWLFTIARNVLNDYFRALKRYSIFSFEGVKQMVSKSKTPEDVVLFTETKDKLSEAINTLDGRERHIIALKFGGCLKNNEIAKILNITESNVGVIIYRSLKKLKQKMVSEEKIYE
ncbi:sigma-70 family RNA polymerase sigma factor [Serpentinicella alkaliphila]|uniref:RNA polymerase sigma-70 factor (ECF subfamily) n=1 Tax=Serpentinicella alkaliphila TaxID=1734049 RepID=A0A4R2UA21_9FIRM|nr:sigma-70 family RNA polymerase sigma factor [Serpentinicella alkaliphila]QUH25220.1 sigma-70 family RNA polymerase sigma factor [Serpentinicella alkaliphila]TCQ07029.1 RNA polymerase sigma-70 factor (ECF subfamily) [Serpentinicella alkaliphila]